MVQINRQEQTCSSPAEGRALPKTMNRSMFCKHGGVGKISKHYGVGHGSVPCRPLFFFFSSSTYCPSTLLLVFFPIICTYLLLSHFSSTSPFLTSVSIIPISSPHSQYSPSTFLLFPPICFFSLSKNPSFSFPISPLYLSSFPPLFLLPFSMSLRTSPPLLPSVMSLLPFPSP